jgi:hypothetical protein
LRSFARPESNGELFTGYRLVRLPDVLLPQLLRPRLRTRIIGRNLYHFFDIDIKWPNDLLIGRKKICGILSEIQAEVDLVKTISRTSDLEHPSALSVINSA